MKKLTMFVASMFFLTSATLVRASEPVPGAEITVEQVPGPIVVKNCITDAKGVFSFTVKDIESAEKLAEKHGQAIKPVKSGDKINLLMIITPPIRFGYTSNQVTITVTIPATSQKQILEFCVLWEKEGDTKTNKGSFAVNPKAQSVR
jgi:hypothetical protein